MSRKVDCTSFSVIVTSLGPVAWTVSMALEQRRGRADLPVALERGDDVVRVELLAVVELHALADREDVGLAVLGDLHAFGELRDRLCVLVARVERLVDMQRDVARGLRRGHVGVERRAAPGRWQ